MLTALVPTPTEAVNTPVTDYKKLYEGTCKDIEKLHEMNRDLKRENAKVREDCNRAEKVAMALNEENCQLHRRLKEVKSCIVKMAMQLHGGDEDA